MFSVFLYMYTFIWFYFKFSGPPSYLYSPPFIHPDFNLPLFPPPLQPTIYYLMPSVFLIALTRQKRSGCEFKILSLLKNILYVYTVRTNTEKINKSYLIMIWLALTWEISILLKMSKVNHGTEKIQSKNTLSFNSHVYWISLYAWYNKMLFSPQQLPQQQLPLPKRWQSLLAAAFGPLTCPSRSARPLPRLS